MSRDKPPLSHMASWHAQGQYFYIFIYTLISAACLVFKSTNHHDFIYGLLYSRLFTSFIPSRAKPVFMRSEAYTILGPSLRKRKQNYE